MKIIVLGGDGFCGWPTSLRLAKAGHDVCIVDNFSRRNIDAELESYSVTDIRTLRVRVDTANSLYDNRGKITQEIINVAESPNKMIDLFKTFKPDAVVHFAEQRAAPYSMISHNHRMYTVDNNINGTNTVLSTIVEVDPNIHLVHLGTMGVYGYSKEFGAIPEGYLDITIKETNQDTSILYPTNPGSIYHMTKSLDQLLFQFYNKNWKLKITDLHQGIVWGTQTEETMAAPELVNRFDYDGVYGTVLNRFIVQAATGHPLTVYGTGGQRRAFIHISDTAECVKLAIENPPENTNRVRIFNQVSEVRGVLELANIIKEKYGAEIQFYDNPRKELAENDLIVHNEGLRSLGFEPITLSDELINDCKFIAEQFADRVKHKNVMNSPKW
jgi:UDP-sulfoquinovose synthase